MSYSVRDVARANEELLSIRTKSARLRDILVSKMEISEEVTALMMDQLRHMTGYAEALASRIALMEKSVTKSPT